MKNKILITGMLSLFMYAVIPISQVVASGEQGDDIKQGASHDLIKNGPILSYFNDFSGENTLTVAFKCEVKIPDNSPETQVNVLIWGGKNLANHQFLPPIIAYKDKPGVGEYNWIRSTEGDDAKENIGNIKLAIGPLSPGDIARITCKQQ